MILVAGKAFGTTVKIGRRLESVIDNDERVTVEQHARQRNAESGLERILTSILISEIQRGALVGPAGDVAHSLGSTPPTGRFQGVGDARKVTMMSNAVGPMVSSIEMDGRGGQSGEPVSVGMVCLG